MTKSKKYVKINLEIKKTTEIRPLGYENYFGMPFIVVSDEYMKEAYNIIGKNLNSFVTEPVDNIEIDNIMENYKEYKENK